MRDYESERKKERWGHREDRREDEAGYAVEEKGETAESVHLPPRSLSRSELRWSQLNLDDPRLSEPAPSLLPSGPSPSRRSEGGSKAGRDELTPEVRRPRTLVREAGEEGVEEEGPPDG